MFCNIKVHFPTKVTDIVYRCHLRNIYWYNTFIDVFSFGFRGLKFLESIALKIRTNNCQCAKHSSMRSGPRFPLNCCPCDLFVLTPEQILIGNCDLGNAGFGKLLLPGWQGSLGRRNLFLLFFSDATVSMRIHGFIIWTVDFVPLECLSGLIMFLRFIEMKPSWKWWYDQVRNLTKANWGIFSDIVGNFYLRWSPNLHLKE